MRKTFYYKFATNKRRNYLSNVLPCSNELQPNPLGYQLHHTKSTDFSFDTLKRQKLAFVKYNPNKGLAQHKLPLLALQRRNKLLLVRVYCDREHAGAVPELRVLDMSLK